MRRAGAIAAVLACIVYTMLATWHGVLMQSASSPALSPQAALELALKTSICHGAVGGQATIPDAVPEQAPSPAQAGDCPVCKGLAACHLALLAAAELGPLAPAAAVDVLDWDHWAGAGRSHVAPRNRGPPRPV